MQGNHVIKDGLNCPLNGALLHRREIAEPATLKFTAPFTERVKMARRLGVAVSKHLPSSLSRNAIEGAIPRFSRRGIACA